MMSEKIKLIMVKRKINSSELANVLECTPQNELNFILARNIRKPAF